VQVDALGSGVGGVGHLDDPWCWATGNYTSEREKGMKMALLQ
jgi:hypothetical protein